MLCILSVDSWQHLSRCLKFVSQVRSDFCGRVFIHRMVCVLLQFLSASQKITELLNDVERLKQALNGLSQLTYSSGSPTKRQSQLVDTLQQRVRDLQQQLAVSVPGTEGWGRRSELVSVTVCERVCECECVAVSVCV